MKSRYLLILAPLALAACGNLPWAKAPEPVAPEAPAEPEKPALKAPEISPLQKAIEVDGARVARPTVDASTAKAGGFKVSGKAGWTVLVGANRAVLKAGGQKDRFIPVNRLTYAKGVEYVGTLGEKAFVLNIRNGACGDAPMTASLKSSVVSGTGCAVPASADIVPPAPKAPKVAAKPKAPKSTKAPVSKPAAAKPAAEPAPTNPAPEAPKAEAPKPDAPKVDTPKVEAPKTEAPKTEAPKTEAPKQDAPKPTTPVLVPTAVPAKS